MERGSQEGVDTSGECNSLTEEKSAFLLWSMATLYQLHRGYSRLALLSERLQGLSVFIALML